MKVCPQCNSSFADDFIYCLNDGNILRNESGEQETVIANRIRVQMTPERGPVTTCASCGLENRMNSSFCKKCGGSLAGYAVAPEPTIAFQSPVFTPPAAVSVSTSGSGNNKTLIVVLALVAIFVIGGAIIYSKRGDSAQNNTASNTNRAANANKAVANTTNTAASVNTAAYPNQPSMIGRQGRLSTNVIIRSDPGNWNANLGSHYKNAQVEVLDQTSFGTPEGISTWYRVRIVQNGCDEEEGLGCGNDRHGVPGQASMEGWMNARLVQLF